MKSATTMDDNLKTLVDISIHALMKSATEVYDRVGYRHCISIHALMKSATPKFKSLKLPNGHFNPRTHEECDLIRSFEI